MTFVAVATLDELKDDIPLACDVGDFDVAIVRHDGTLYAIRDECSHARVALSEGDVVDCSIECFLHGASFDLRTGEALSLPASQPVPVYPITVDGENVLVDIDNPITDFADGETN